MRVALCPLLVLAGICKVATFGQFLKNMDAISTVAESVTGNHYNDYTLELPDAAFCTSLASGWSQNGWTLLDDTQKCGDMATESECGYGNKVFRRSENVANLYDTCRWVPHPKKQQASGPPSCRLSRWSISCKESCLPAEGAGSAASTMENVAPTVASTPSGSSVTCNGITREFPSTTTATCKCVFRHTDGGAKEVCEFNLVHNAGSGRRLQGGDCQDSAATSTLDLVSDPPLLVEEWESCSYSHGSNGPECKCSDKVKVSVYDSSELVGATPEEQVDNIKECEAALPTAWDYFYCSDGDSPTCTKVTDPILAPLGFTFEAGTYPGCKCWQQCANGCQAN